MDDYKKKRIDYVNMWPNAPLFEIEQSYQNRCKKFISNHSDMPFSPIKLWYDSGIEYHIFVSKLIESLEMMPNWPNRAFAFLFSGFDHYSKERSGQQNITIRLKNISSEIYQLSNNTGTVRKILDQLFTNIPMSAAAYIYKRESQETNVLTRLTTASNMQPNTLNGLLCAVNAKYSNHKIDPTIRRNAGALIRVLFKQDHVVINGQTYSIDNEMRLNMLLSGYLYSLRNDALHGASIAITKSSQTTISRYALNYYAFVALYTISMLLIIKWEIPAKMNGYYSDLLDNVLNNMENMRDLFGNHLSR